MTRLERSKREFVKLNVSDKQAYLVFQLLINNLPTYKEKSEFYQFYVEFTNGKKRKVLQEQR